MCVESLNTLGVVMPPMSNTSIWGPDCQSTTVIASARTVTMLGYLIDKLKGYYGSGIS